MHINRAVIYQNNLPLKIPFKHASSGYIDSLEEIYLKLEADDGTVGFGEVRGNCSYFTGDTTEAVIATLKSAILPVLFEIDLTNINQTHDKIENAIVGNMASKAIADIAIYDLISKYYGLPLWNLLGGARKMRLPTEENIPFCSLEETRKNAKALLDDGCRFIKVRVGLKPFQKDVERVKAVYEVVKQLHLESETEIAIDANQSWETKEALVNIKVLQQYGLKIVEQPVPAKHADSLRMLHENLDVKIFADEAVFSVDDLVNLINENAIDGLHIKLIKSGGIYNAVRMMDIAEAHHLSYMVGGMDEGMLAVAAAVQCGAVSRTNLFELNGHCRIKEDPCSGLEVSHSTVMVPTGIGLGIHVNEKQLHEIYKENRN